VEDYKTLHNQFRRYGIKIMLDFVPNHYGYQSPLVRNHPEYFIHSDEEPEEKELFRKVETIKGEKWIAHGKDPYFPPWDDTYQLNYYSQETRDFMREKAIEIAQLCDGLRCDMSMLCTNSVIKLNWDWLMKDNTEIPNYDFWRDTISKVKAKYPKFVFMAEVYWGMEWELMEQGFDYAYDKTLYDNLVADEIEQIHGYLNAELSYQQSLCRFIENHDESRAAGVMDENQSIAAAAVVSTLPGLTMYHQGQLAGDRIKIPVQLRNKQKEPLNRNIKRAYHRILQYLNLLKTEDLEWRKNDIYETNEKNHSGLISWNWLNREYLFLIVINYSKQKASGLVEIDLSHLLFEQAEIVFRDHLNDENYTWKTSDLEKGLYVNLNPYAIHLFTVESKF
jgi:glycosidase